MIRKDNQKSNNRDHPLEPQTHRFNHSSLHQNVMIMPKVWSNNRALKIEIKEKERNLNLKAIEDQ